jgi:drug/metabolite transporter (DMT)-like permease
MGVKEILKPWLGALFVFIGAVFFSAKAVTVKLCYQYGVDTLSLLVLRMVFSLPFYIAILLYYNKKYPSKNIQKKEWYLIIFLGIVGYYGASYFDFSGLKYITASLERLILFIYPTIVVIISSILFKRRINGNQIIALILTYAGILFAVLHDLHQDQHNVLIGGLLIFLSAVTYAMYLIGTEKLIPLIGTVRFTSYAMIVSTIAVIIHYLLAQKIEVFELKKEVYYLSIFMAVFSTVIPSFLISEGIRMVGSGTASIIGSIGPVSTIILAYIFLGEDIGAYQIIGTLLVLTGVLIVSRKKEIIPDSFSFVKNIKNPFN